MASAALDSLTDTWNAGATTFRAIKMNVTDTASAAGSLLMDLQVGGNTKANISKAGLLTLASGVTLTGANTLQTTTGALTLASGSSHIIATPTSNFGIGTTGPDRKLDVLDAGGSAQFRTTYTDGSVYTDYQTLSGGSTLISDSSGRMINSTIVNNTAVSARAMRGGLAFDGVTTSTKDVHTIPSVGTSDNTLRAVFVSNASQTTFTSVAFLGSSGSYTHVAAGSYALRMDSNSLIVVFYGATTSDYNLWTYTGFGAAYNGKVVDVAVVKSSSGNVVIYINGVDVSSLGSFTTAGTPPTWQGSITNTYLMAGAGKSDAIFNGTIYGVQLFNRALSASEVIDLANKGVAESDKWASLTGQTSGTLTVGKRYRITTFVAGDSFTNVGAASNATGVEFVATGTTPTTWTNSSTLNKIGCLLDADLAVGVGYQAPDRSSNHYDGLISTSGVSHVIEVRRQQARFTLSADGYLGDTTSRACLPDNARIDSITAYSAGTPTFTIGDDSGSAANVVASVTLTASTLTDLTLLKRFLTTGVDGRCYVDFTAGAAATYFTINYSTTANY